MSTRRAPILSCIVSALLGFASAEPVEEELSQTETEYAVLARLAQQSLLLDASSADGTNAAVGERGHILISNDDGESWRQVRVPTSATLTGVYFFDSEQGWVVGHDSVILRTLDGGESWELVHSAPDRNQPLFDVWFDDREHGYAIGSYGYFLTTEDGGETWAERLLTADALETQSTEEEEPEDEREWWEMDEQDFSQGIDVHLNHIAKSDTGRLYIAAEAGAIFRSDDGGGSWLSLPSPYEGSFFGTLPLGSDSLLLFGLRGNLFRSDDAGLTWTKIDTSTVAMLTSAVRLDDGTIVLTGLAGALLVSEDDGHSFRLYQQADRNGISIALVGRDESLILVGEAGIRLLSRQDYSGDGS